MTKEEFIELATGLYYFKKSPKEFGAKMRGLLHLYEAGREPQMEVKIFAQGLLAEIQARQVKHENHRLYNLGWEQLEMLVYGYVECNCPAALEPEPEPEDNDDNDEDDFQCCDRCDRPDACRDFRCWREQTLSAAPEKCWLKRGAESITYIREDLALQPSPWRPIHSEDDWPEPYRP